MTAAHADVALNAVTAQAPAMLALSTRVGALPEHGQPVIARLKVAISRWDEATVQSRDDSGVFITFQDAYGTHIDYQDIPQDDLRVLFRVIEALRSALERPKPASGLDITIEKHIPFDSHLGGTGASAAALFTALAKLWDAQLTREELINIAQHIEPEIAEALTGGVLVGVSEPDHYFAVPLLTQAELACVVVPAAVDITLTEMLSTLRQQRGHTTGEDDTVAFPFDDALLQAVAHGDAQQLGLRMVNDFQAALIELLPEHHEWLTAGMAEGALNAQTIDRGPSLVFIVEDHDQAQDLAERFSEAMDITAVTEYWPVSGAEIISS